MARKGNSFLEIGEKIAISLAFAARFCYDGENISFGGGICEPTYDVQEYGGGCTPLSAARGLLYPQFSRNRGGDRRVGRNLQKRAVRTGRRT